MFADDVVIIIQEKNLAHYIEVFEETAKEFFLIINKKKSGLMRIIKRKMVIKDSKQELHGYPVVTSYRYLGVIIDGKGKVDI